MFNFENHGKKPVQEKPVRQEKIEQDNSAEIAMSIRMIAEFVKKQTNDLKDRSATHEELKDEIAQLRGEMQSQLGKLHSLKTSNPDMEKRVDKLHANVSDLMHMKSRHDDLDKSVRELHTAIGQKAMEGMVGNKDVVDAHVQRIYDLERKVDNLNKIVSNSGKGLALSRMKEELDSELKQFRDDMESRISTGKPVHHEDQAIVRLAHEIEYLRAEMEKSKSRPSDEYEGGAGQEIEQLKNAIDEESALRLGFDKKIRELHHHYKAMSEEIDKLKQSGPAPAMGQNDVDIGRKVRDEINKTVAKQLDDFAKILDKRMPQLVTRDDLAKIEARFAKAPQAQQPQPIQDVGSGINGEAIDRKIAVLEQRMNELVSALKGYTGSFVIE